MNEKEKASVWHRSYTASATAKRFISTLFAPLLLYGYPSKATKSGYAYATFDTLKEAREFVESGKARQANGIRHSEIQTVEQAIDKWLEICEHEGRDEREPVSPSTLENYRWHSRTMKAYGWDRALRDLQEADIIAFRSWLKRNCTADQAQKVLSSFHSVLIEMKRRGVIDTDPAENVSLRSNPRHKEPVKIPSVPDRDTDALWRQ